VIGDHLLLIEARVAAMRDLPWLIPAVVIIEFSDEDLDRLDMVADSEDEYWGVLNAIVVHIEGEL